MPLNDKYRRYNKKRVDDETRKKQQSTAKSIGNSAYQAAKSIAEKVASSGGERKTTYKDYYVKYGDTSKKQATQTKTEEGKGTGRPYVTESQRQTAKQKGRELTKRVTQPLQVQGSGSKYNANGGNNSFGRRSLDSKQRDEQRWVCHPRQAVSSYQTHMTPCLTTLSWER